MKADPRATACYLGEFFGQLVRCGVRFVVVSPGSRSTPLSMAAFELSQRRPDLLQVIVDVDERGAAFVALGIGKATGMPAAAVCTSGTAVGNWYPAVLEAESSRVPLLLLSGDRPPQLQGFGAPQTCDQLHAFGSHVRAFRQMVMPSDDEEVLSFARQAALEAVFRAQGDAAPATRIAGACNGGPVHLNFPFDEPLKPDFSVWDSEAVEAAGEAEATEGSDGSGSVRAANRPREAQLSDPRQGLSALLWSHNALDPVQARRFANLLSHEGKVLVLAGEGTCASDEEAAAVLSWARAFELPVLADPLSGLRRFDDSLVVDGYDTVVGAGGAVPDALMPSIIVRFGRYPVSKKVTQLAARSGAFQIVVDPLESRDFNAATDALVACRPVDFARALLESHAVSGEEESRAILANAAFLGAWQQADERARRACISVGASPDADRLEGAYVRATLELAPENSLVFAANSMSIRALDTFYPKGRKLTVLCNRGLNGIDGTLSTAIGAVLGRAGCTGAGAGCHGTFVTGDLTLQHDLNALSLQRELLMLAERHRADLGLTVVLLNNNGGAIFDMLPQCSDEPYFERLFLTPQDVDFQAAARTFGVPSWRATSLAAFESAYAEALARPGLTLVEMQLPLRGVKERYAPHWTA